MMPIFSRRRLDCFYCGKKSVHRYEQGLQKWKCEHCLAENYLDANGEITEPPAPSTPASGQTQRFARLDTRSASPKVQKLEESPFCQTCLNNQYLITQNLSNYLPETTDPQYSQFEANLPKYKKELEVRYPPVCATCEPKVRERMRAAGKVAKADYLGRMMDKTRQIGRTQDLWGPRSMLRILGGLLWLAASVLMVIWNCMGTLARDPESGDDIAYDLEDINVLKCIGQAVDFGRVDSTCTAVTYSLAGWGVAASLISFWWNPIMRRRNIDRTLGLAEYYKLQIILLAIRCGAWYVLGVQHQHGLETAIVRALHATMLSMNIGVPLLAYRTARLAKIPRISFQDNYEPDIRPLQDGKYGSNGTPRSGPSLNPAVSSAITTASIGFPFNRVNAAQTSTPSTPVKTASEVISDDSDAMDIDTPFSKHNFRPISDRDGEDKIQEPSPFYGRIPPAPVSQERRLRNPPNKPSFQKTSAQRQEKFFHSMTGVQTNILDQGSKPPIEFQMQPPKMVIKDDYQETGLENWFSSNVFSLRDANVVAPDARVSEISTVGMSIELIGRIFPFITLLVATATWQYASNSRTELLVLFYSAAGLAAVVAGFRFTTVISGPVVNVSDVLLCMVELFGAAALGHQTRKTILSGSDIASSLGSFPILYFSFMAIQEVLVLFMTSRTLRTSGPQTSNLTKQHGESGFSALPRGGKALPPDEGATLFSQSLPAASSPTSPMQHTTRAFSPSNGITAQSSHSQSLAGLSLSGENVSRPPINAFSTTAQRSTRVLRGQAQKPWEVGGI